MGVSLVSLPHLQFPMPLQAVPTCGERVKFVDSPKFLSSRAKSEHSPFAWPPRSKLRGMAPSAIQVVRAADLAHFSQRGTGAATKETDRSCRMKPLISFIKG